MATIEPIKKMTPETKIANKDAKKDFQKLIDLAENAQRRLLLVCGNAEK